MRKNVFISLILCVLLLGFGSAFAATSQIDNVPGGAGYSYMQASASGNITLFNIQNVDISAVMVHLVFYNSNSEEILSIPVPLSGYDNWGASISGNGTTITITPQTPCFYSGVNNGCFTPQVRTLAAGADGMQRGYIAYVVSRGDAGFYGGNNNGDPRTDPLLSGANARLLDHLMGRAAYITPGSASAFAANGAMMQGFVNFTNANEALVGAGGGWDSIADAYSDMFYNCDNDTGDVFPGSDDANGVRLDTWELYLSNWVAWGLIADDTNAGGIGDTFYSAFGGKSRGASNGAANPASPASYWGRYNAGAGLTTWMLGVFPANSGPNNVAACGLGSRAITGISCDDNEFCPDFILNPTEVFAVAFGPSGPPISGTSGEARITVQAPLAGFTYTESATFADIYPLVAEGKYVNAADGFQGFWATGHTTDPLVTEVIQLGKQLSHP